MRDVWIFLGLILVLGGVATAQPEWFAPAGKWIPLMLGVVMFGMGVTLETGDFARIARRPLPVLLGTGLQYGVMPVAGLTAAWLTGAEPVVLLGFVLVGAAPGGTASNVIAYFARADVPLSVTMTAISTMLAPLFMPFWTKLLAGHALPVDFLGMAKSTFQIVVIPVVLGMLAGSAGSRLRELSGKVMPLVSGAIVAFIIAIIVAGSRERLLAAPVAIFLGVLLHNGFGLCVGWLTPRLMGRSPAECRTMAIEVGMQNSGLAAALAAVHFPAGAGLPAALFSVWQNLSGAALASIWRSRPAVGYGEPRRTGLFASKRKTGENSAP